MGHQFWARVRIGFLSAFQEGVTEPFGIWPMPAQALPLPFSGQRPTARSTTKGNSRD